MRILFLSLLFFSYLLVIAHSDILPTPTGGGVLKIYTPGAYAFAPDHDDFDVNLQENGFTIEMWVYIGSPLKMFSWAKNPDKQQLKDLWALLYKKGSYELIILPSYEHPYYTPHFTLMGPDFVSSYSFPNNSLEMNQWHYLAVMLGEHQGKTYLVRVIDNKLYGRTNLGRGLADLHSTNAPFCIGGGRTLPEEVIEKKNLWDDFTGGLIDEVRISNIVRYPPQAALDKMLWEETIEVPTEPFEPDEHTIALWHFDFDNARGGSRFFDASRNGHHLTYHGDYLSVQPRWKLATTWGHLKKGD